MRPYQCYMADIENMAPVDRLPALKSCTQSSRKVADVVTLAVPHLRHADLMSRIAPRRRLFSQRRGASLVEYSSLILLVAIATLATMTQFQGGNDVPPAARIISSN
jgi:Flp pilus assembly pilin Flp